MPFSYLPPETGRLVQGEIITGLFAIQPHLERSDTIPDDLNELTMAPFDHAWAIVVTNDCDLLFDYQAAAPGAATPHKLLHQILYCPVWPRGSLPGGKSDLYRNIRSNNDARYHYFPEVRDPEVPTAGVVIPELYADFKLFFGLPVGYAYALLGSRNVRRVGRVDTPYMQHFMQRFFFWNSRMALPD